MQESRRIDQDGSLRASADQRIREHARALGFDLVGVARADVALGIEHERYEEFIAREMHGEMTFLAELAGARRTLDNEAVFCGAKSVICVAKAYCREEGAERGVAPFVARYARGRDYHNFLKKRLRKLAVFVRGLAPGAEARAVVHDGAASGPKPQPAQARALCDIEPVLERAWAARAGLGFVGKNGLVIAPGTGSYVLLGEVVTNLELVPDTPMTERCGSCTRCLDACPTQAFVAPFVLDARRCVSYLTIEAKGAPAEELRAGIGEHLFGCDDCQDVCPFNKTAPPKEARTRDFAPLEEWQSRGLDDLAAMDEAEFDRLTPGSPMRRAKRAGLARNAALVAANRLIAGKGGEPEERCLRVAAEHEEAAVREVAAWGLARIEDGTRRAAR